MIIDDENDLLTLEKRCLSRAGYDVSVTTSCSEGAHILTLYRSNLIFIYINVGSEDGTELCKEMESQVEHKHTPTFVTSANDVSLKTYEDYDAGSFLKRPYQRSELLDVTAAYLSKG